MPFDQIGLMLFEGVIASCLLLLLFHRRHTWGLSPLYLGLGVFQHLQVVLATTIYIEVWPNVFVSPGSAILFTASMFAILLVYIDSDADETRKLIHGLVIANAALALLSYISSLHLLSDATENIFNLPRAYFVQDLRVVIAGTVVVFLDAILLIVIYEALSKRLLRWMFLRIYLSITFVLVFDQILFTTVAFAPSPQYVSILINGLIGKVASALFYSFVLWTYQRYVSAPDSIVGERRPFDVFSLLSYRQKYDLLGKEYNLLDDRVRDRTRELQRVNKCLQLEVEERKKTERTLREREGRLEKLSRKLMNAHESERRLLARELHDEIGQALTFIRLKLDQPTSTKRQEDPSDFKQVLKIVDETIQKVRQLSHQLRPAVLDDLGLMAALEWQSQLVSERAALPVDFDLNIEDAQLSTEVRTACFRIAQEALTNVMRHAEASRVQISLSESHGEIKLVIQDDGIGFEVRKCHSNVIDGRGFGLSGMQERAELINGQLDITSQLGVGTQLQFVFPVAGVAKGELRGEHA